MKKESFYQLIFSLFGAVLGYLTVSFVYKTYETTDIVLYEMMFAAIALSSSLSPTGVNNRFRYISANSVIEAYRDYVLLIIFSGFILIASGALIWLLNIFNFSTGLVVFYLGLNVIDKSDSILVGAGKLFVLRVFQFLEKLLLFTVVSVHIALGSSIGDLMNSVIVVLFISRLVGGALGFYHLFFWRDLIKIWKRPLVFRCSDVVRKSELLKSSYSLNSLLAGMSALGVFVFKDLFSKEAAVFFVLFSLINRTLNLTKLIGKALFLPYIYDGGKEFYKTKYRKVFIKLGPVILGILISVIYIRLIDKELFGAYVYLIILSNIAVFYLWTDAYLKGQYLMNRGNIVELNRSLIVTLFGYFILSSLVPIWSSEILFLLFFIVELIRNFLLLYYAKNTIVS